WQRRGDVLSLGDKQLDYALVLCVEDLIVDELCPPPCPCRIDHLDEWDGTLPIGPEGNAPSFVSAREVPLAPRSTGEQTGTLCQQPSGFGSTDDLRAPNALLGCECRSGDRPRRFTKEYAQPGSGSGEIGLPPRCVGRGAVAFQLRASRVGFGSDTSLSGSAVVRD